jgi:hypothetical protein
LPTARASTEDVKACVEVCSGQVGRIFLKLRAYEGRKVKEQEAIIAELKAGTTALAAAVKEQAAQLQR